MVFNPAAGAFTKAFDEKTTSRLNRRAKNREVFMKFVDAASASGRTVDLAEYDALRTSLANGNNFFTGTIPYGDALQAINDRANEEADIVRDIEATDKVKREEKETVLFFDRALRSADSDLPSFISSFAKGFETQEEADLVLAGLGGAEEVYNRVRRDNIAKFMSDPRVEIIKKPEDVDTLFPGQPKYILDAMRAIGTERLAVQNDSNLSAALALADEVEADFFRDVLVDGDLADGALDAKVESILKQSQAAPTSQNRMLIKEQLRGSLRRLSKDRENIFENAVLSNTDYRAALARGADEEELFAIAQVIASAADYHLEIDSVVWRNIQAADTVVERTLDAERYDQQRATMLAAVLTAATDAAKKTQTSIKAMIGDFDNESPVQQAMFRAANRLTASDGYITSNIDALIEHLKIVTTKALDEGLSVLEAATIAYNSAIALPYMKTTEETIASNSDAAIANRFGIPPDSTFGKEGAGGYYDGTLVDLIGKDGSLSRVSKLMSEAPENTDKANDAMRRRNSLVDDIDKVRETLLNNINNHVIRINDPENARALLVRLQEAKEVLLKMKPSGEAVKSPGFHQRRPPLESIGAVEQGGVYIPDPVALDTLPVAEIKVVKDLVERILRNDTGLYKRGDGESRSKFLDRMSMMMENFSDIIARSEPNLADRQGDILKELVRGISTRGGVGDYLTDGRPPSKAVYDSRGDFPSPAPSSLSDAEKADRERDAPMAAPRDGSDDYSTVLFPELYTPLSSIPSSLSDAEKADRERDVPMARTRGQAQRDAVPPGEIDFDAYNTSLVGAGNVGADNVPPYGDWPSGPRVVNDVIAIVDRLFPGGTELLREVAAVESDFGRHPDTFKPEVSGGGIGIWQVNKNTGFLATKDVGSHPKLKIAHKRIKDELGIDWDEITFEDLKRPLISALAARLVFLTIPGEIPRDLKGRAAYWQKYYNTDAGDGTVERYVDVVMAMNSSY